MLLHGEGGCFKVLSWQKQLRVLILPSLNEWWTCERDKKLTQSNQKRIYLDSIHQRAFIGHFPRCDRVSCLGTVQIPSCPFWHCCDLSELQLNLKYLLYVFFLSLKPSTIGCLRLFVKDMHNGNTVFWVVLQKKGKIRRINHLLDETHLFKPSPELKVVNYLWRVEMSCVYYVYS